MADIDYDAVIADYYREMELDIIASMKRNLSRHIKDEENVGFDFPQWQAMKLKELKRYQRQNQRIVAGVGNKVSKKVSEHMLDELAQGSKKEMKRYKDIMGDSYQSSVLMKDSFFKINDRKVNALIGALTDDLSDANYAALRMVNDTYRDVIFKASLFAANGVKTPKQAIDMATRDFLERGINCIEYKNGRRVNIASYAQMAVRTAGKRANLMGEGERRHALGVPFVKISRHGTSCKLCKPFEGKVLIDDVYSGGTASDGKYMLLSQAMAQGLFHPNCRHGCSTHDPRDDDDYDEPQREDSDGEALKEEYTHAQRMVQKYKRLSAGSLDPENVARYSEKLREWEERELQIKKGILRDAETQKEKFIPAKTIKEAESFISQYVDKTIFGGVGVSYQGINLDVANEVNRTLSNLFKKYNAPKIGGIVAPTGNSKLGKLMSNATAGYSPVRKSFILNRSSMKTMKTADKAFKAEREALSDLINHPEKYDFSKISKSVIDVVERSKVSGRATVPENINETLTHEFGHMLERQISSHNLFDSVKANMSKYAEQISGYAGSDISEYIAESFASYEKGERVADPDLIAIFKSLER